MTGNGLTITRKPGESIQIGADVVVTLTTIGRERDRAGIAVQAPHHVRVQRAEQGVMPPPAEDGCTCPAHGAWVRAEDVRRLTHELDVAINGAAGAAPFPVLCDIVAQVKSRGLLAPVRRAVGGEAPVAVATIGEGGSPRGYCWTGCVFDLPAGDYWLFACPKTGGPKSGAPAAAVAG